MMKHTHLGYFRPVLHNQLLTLYTNHRLPTLGSIQSMNKKYIWKPTDLGKAAEAVLKSSQRVSKIIMIQEFVVMPNHIHLLISYRFGNVPFIALKFVTSIHYVLFVKVYKTITTAGTMIYCIKMPKMLYYEKKKKPTNNSSSIFPHRLPKKIFICSIAMVFA